MDKTTNCDQMANLLTTGDVVNSFGVTRETVANWRKKGLRWTPRGLSGYLYRREDVVAFIEEQRALRANKKAGGDDGRIY